MVGPLAWPDAYEDVIGFTLWPQKYGERLRIHGIGDVLSTLFKPAALASRTRTEMARVADASKQPAWQPRIQSATAAARQALPDWPTAQIERSIELTAAQRTALDELRAAIGEAVAAIKATCRDEPAMTPVERIRALQNTLWTVRDAAILIRAPLARFLQLADRRAEEAVRHFRRRSRPARHGDEWRQAAGRDEIARMCGMSKHGRMAGARHRRDLQPTAAQRASLETMQKKSFEMGQFLMASCLQPIPSTPAARLDAAVDRLTAVIFADIQHQPCAQRLLQSAERPAEGSKIQLIRSAGLTVDCGLAAITCRT